ncbi:MAG TPA: hypothetical protein VGD80_16335, partial [Kofleriaceae bacterium]
MVALSWVCCGVAPVRLELFGLVDDEAPDAPRLLSLTGIRAVHLEGDALHEIARVQVEEILLDDAIELAPLEATATADGERATSTIAGLPGRVVVEGIEGADGRFLDLIGMTGWKLVLEQQGDLDFACAWFLFGDWPIETHPDYFPGTTIGEVSFEGRFGPAAVGEQLAIELPWPFAAGRLPIVSPVRQQGRWRAGLDVSRLGGSVFDGMGRALRDFSLGVIDLSSAARSAVNALPGGLTDAVRLEAGLDEHGQPGLRLAIMVHDEIALGELAGQRLI